MIGAPRLSIARSLSLVASLAFGIAALREGTATWDSTAWTVSLFAIPAAGIIAIIAKGATRAFWAGFAIFAAVQFVATHWPGEPPLRSRLITRAAILALADQCFPDLEIALEEDPDAPGTLTTADPLAKDRVFTSDGAVRSGVSFKQQPGGPSGGGFRAMAPTPVQQIRSATLAPTTAVVRQLPLYFISIGESLFVIIVGIIGGAFAQIMFRTNQRRNARGAGTDPSANSATPMSSTPR
jgi:hypothetical protein